MRNKPALRLIVLLIAVIAQNVFPENRVHAAEPTVSSVGPDYRIGPGDVLRIFVLNNPELATEVPVRPDGRISTPLVPDLVAVDQTPAALAQELERRLSELVRNPSVSVIVVNAVSALSQIRVVGQAANPKAVPYRSGLGVLDLVIEVGGLSQFAAGNRAKIVRIEGGKPKEIRVRLADLINKGDISQNLPLRPGDVLVIPEAIF